MNLRTISNLAETFGVTVGFSDHMIGIAMLIATVFLGARIVEKHVTLSKSIPGPDSTFSLEPSAFKTKVSFVKETEKALRRVCYSMTNSEQTNHYSVVIFIRSNSMIQTV